MIGNSVGPVEMADSAFWPDAMLFKFCEVPKPGSGQVDLGHQPSVFRPKQSGKASGLRWHSGEAGTVERDLTINAPTVSIVFTTIRPGGYDVLLESLARQTSMDYELICIDSLADQRRHLIMAYAARLGIADKISIIRPDKQQTKANNCPFGFANAINTGALLARGKVFSGVTDYTWLPSTFVENAVNHFARHPNTLLAHQQAYFYFPEHLLNHSAVHDVEAMSSFTEPMTASPEELGWPLKPDDFTPLQIPKAIALYQDQYYWDGTALTLSMELLEKLNGWDELMDSGKESHNMDIADRALWMFGAQVYIDGSLMLGNIAHHEVKTDDAFYVAPDKMVFSNVYRWVADLLPRIKRREYPAKARNYFDIRDVRRTRDPAKPLEEALARYDPGPLAPNVTFISPEPFKFTEGEAVLFRLNVTNFEVGKDGMLCFIIIPKGVVKTKANCVDTWGERGATEGAVFNFPKGIWYIRAYLQDMNGVAVPSSDAVLSFQVPGEENQLPY